MLRALTSDGTGSRSGLHAGAADGSPMTYMLNGQQYLVVAISGGTYPGELVAFRAPQAATTTAQLR